MSIYSHSFHCCARLAGTYLHPARLALPIITVGRFQAIILVDSIAILIKGLVLIYERKQVSNIHTTVAI
jgi:hypothetical protein